MSTIINGSSPSITFSDGSAQTSATRPFQNRIINGGMSIWQRGTSSSSIGYQTVDRWSFYADSSRTVSRSTDVPTGFQYSTSLSGTGSTGLTQKIESINCYGIAGNSITISFYLKQTTGAGSNAIGLNLYYANAADDWSASTQISTTQNFTTTSGWAQYSATFSNMPANSVNGLQVTIVTNSGSAVVFLLTGVQLEVGSTATSFDYRSIGTELQLCYRYCYALYKGDNIYYANGLYYNSTNVRTQIQFPVSMRTTPTISYTGYSSFYRDNTLDANNVNGWTVNAGNSNTVQLSSSNSMSGTAGQSGLLYAAGGSQLIFLAEL